MILEKVPRKWRGVLSRWLLELRPGVFLGNPTQRVRDELWKKLTQRPPIGYVLQLWSNRQPQGFDYRQYGQSTRMLEDHEGLALVVLRRTNRKSDKVAKRKRDQLTHLRDPASGVLDTVRQTGPHSPKDD
jgi:CRISPR-associated protein Cas2